MATSWKNEIVVVLGQYRGGTSAVAGVVKGLGAWGGESDVRPPNISNPTGFHEEPGLDTVCKGFFSLPDHSPKGEISDRVLGLVEWRRLMEKNCPDNVRFVVAKNPLLCLLTEAIHTAWPDAKYIGVRRDLKHSCRSIIQRDWGWDREHIMHALSSMVEERDSFLYGKDVHWLDYEALVNEPVLETNRISDFLGIEIGQDEIIGAAGIIDPRLRRSNREQSRIDRFSSWIHAQLVSFSNRRRGAR